VTTPMLESIGNWALLTGGHYTRPEPAVRGASHLAAWMWRVR
jgi:hypothetical protein